MRATLVLGSGVSGGLCVAGGKPNWQGPADLPHGMAAGLVRGCEQGNRALLGGRRRLDPGLGRAQRPS